MNQLNEEIRLIQTQISTLENRLYNNRTMWTGEQIQSVTDQLIQLHHELKIRLKQTNEI